ncbi:MAG: hydrolase [Alphaproteobacteria bacterium]|nr:hydrolase [Alphaproteobacteria bacterium]
MRDFSSDLGFLAGRRAEMTATLKDWCAINSGSRNIDGLDRMRDVLVTAFGELEGDVEIAPAEQHEVVTRDGEVERTPAGGSVRVVKRPQAPIRVLLAGHMDTVFPPDHPFQTHRMIDDDVMNAPGAADMKGGLLVMLRALQCVEQSAVADAIGYEVVINADEEIGSHGSAATIAAAARRAHFACVYEPSLPDGTLAGARKGSGNFSAIFRGRSAHAGREHHLGRNAVVAASRFAERIDRMSGARAGMTVNVARIDGGSPNNVVPESAVVRFNVRVELGDDAAWAEAELNKLIAAANAEDGFGAQLHGGFGRPPKPMTPELLSFFEAVKSVGAELGQEIGWKATGGCCDGNNIAAEGTPVVDTLGVRGANIHSADEYARLDSLEERAKLSALLLMRIASGDIPAPGRVT